MTYGIRPEHLALAPDGEGLAGEVVVVEPTGAEIMVVVNVAGQDLQVVFKERHRFRPGDKITLKPDLATVHVFDKTSEQRITA